MTKRYFKIKYGYSAADQVSIGENELDKAIYAQVSGKPIQIGQAYINGKNIISITPHYHKHTGWFDWYEPTSGDDWNQIQRDCPSYDGIIEAHKQHVHELITSNKLNLIGSRDYSQMSSLSEGNKTNGIHTLRQVPQ